MSFAPALMLREGDREKLGDLAPPAERPSGLAKRARMVLLAADRVPNAEIASKVGVSRPTVIADPGTGPDRADAPAATRPGRPADPRLEAERHHHPVRRPGGRQRQDHRGRLLRPPPDQEFLRFLKKVAAAHPGVGLHVVLDNYPTRKRPGGRRRLAESANQPITPHSTRPAGPD
jgi:hypothetical protein